MMELEIIEHDYMRSLKYQYFKQIRVLDLESEVNQKPRFNTWGRGGGNILLLDFSRSEASDVNSAIFGSFEKCLMDTVWQPQILKDNFLTSTG